MAKLAAAALALLLVAAPRLAEACAVCMSGREDENQLAFILTTIFLSVLPPACIGGAIYWLVRRARQAEADEAARREPAPPRLPLAS